MIKKVTYLSNDYSINLLLCETIPRFIKEFYVKYKSEIYVKYLSEIVYFLTMEDKLLNKFQLHKYQKMYLNLAATIIKHS
jgi:hypothetical protein